jgi:aspartate kinase
MISQGASKVNVSFIIDDEQAPGLVLALHKHFFGTANDRVRSGSKK